MTIEEELHSPAVITAMRLLDQKNQIDQAVKDAMREALRDILTIARVGGSVDFELKGLVERTERAMNLRVADFDNCIAQIMQKMDKHYETCAATVAKKAETIIAKAEKMMADDEMCNLILA